MECLPSRQEVWRQHALVSLSEAALGLPAGLPSHTQQLVTFVHMLVHGPAAIDSPWVRLPAHTHLLETVVRVWAWRETRIRRFYYPEGGGALQELEGAQFGQVVTQFAPDVSCGHLHFGHLKACLLSERYTEAGWS